MTAWAGLGLNGMVDVARAQLRDLMEQLRRESGRRAWLADLRHVPSALRWALPWALLGRTSRDANPCRWLLRQSRRRPEVVAVSDPTRALTFEQLLRESHAAAECLARLGVSAGTRVAILLPTGVDLVVTLLGCWRLGSVPCPLDPGAATSVLDAVRAQLGARLEISDREQISADPSGVSAPTWAMPYAPLHATQLAMILPTSGSEGHVKLCRVTAGRLALSGHAFGGVALGCRRGDVIYCPLPLCHATGITVGLMPALVHGVTLHLPGRFSASKLLQELRDSVATQLVYVGDLLRMAVAAITNDAERAARPITHRVRVAVGNGLDQRTALRSAEHLKIPRIVEFYGATEAPRVLLNLSNKAGSCGRVALRRISRFVVVKERATAPSTSDRSARVDPREPVATARWVPCEPGEVGELWIRIPFQPRPWLGDFEGYLDRAHERRVVLENVFRPGDRFYRTQDLVRYDEDDYFYFVDRLGDVWRHRGHNVSTTWLADELRQVNGVDDACVLPVALDESARRFGLALLVMTDDGRTRVALTNQIKCLPSYAQPQLIQLVPTIARTHSFKPKRSGSTTNSFQPTEDAIALFVWERDVLRRIERHEWSAERQRLLGE